MFLGLRYFLTIVIFLELLSVLQSSFSFCSIVCRGDELCHCPQILRSGVHLLYPIPCRCCKLSHVLFPPDWRCKHRMRPNQWITNIEIDGFIILNGYLWKTGIALTVSLSAPQHWWHQGALWNIAPLKPRPWCGRCVNNKVFRSCTASRKPAYVRHWWNYSGTKVCMFRL